MLTEDDKKYMDLAYLEANHTNCIKGKVGAILVKNHKILGTGHNVIPVGLKPCTEQNCIRKKKRLKQGTHQELCRAIHAEQSAILDAFSKKKALEGSTLYTTKFPCTICTRMIIYVGIKKIIYDAPYPDEESFKMLKEAHIELFQLEKKEKI